MPVRRRGLSATVGIVLLSGATSVEAASPARDFASSGTAIISADQLMPIVSYISSTTTNTGGSKTTNSVTSVSLVTASGGNAASALTFRMMPRLAFDYVVGPGITVGGSAWVFTNVSASQTITPAGGATSQSTDQPKGTYWGIGPRIGYAFPLGDIVAIWPRVGIEYGDIEIGSVTSNGVSINGGSINQLSLDLDGLLVVTPIEHLGFAIGPVAAIPLTGKVSATTTVTGTSASASNDIAMWYVALSLNLLGYF